MGFLRRLFAWLFVPDPADQVQGQRGLYSLDVERIARETKLEAEARRLGEAGLPDEADTQLTGIEANLVRRIEKARQDYLSWAAEQLKALNQEIERRDITAIVNNAGQADREFERTASGLIAERDRILAELADDARRCQAELEAFRERHGLRRAARYPDGSGRFYRYSLLVLLIVCEAALNAVFFAKGIDTGLIGGFLYAASFAFGNVAFAYAWGRWGLPNLNHRHGFRKLAGVLSFATALATALVIGLLIAHFRDALTADLADAPRAALAALKAAPFALQEVHSWALLGISLLFAAIALADGYGLDDPYPGYGPLDARSRVAAEDFGVELDDLRQALQDLKDDALAGLDRSLTEARLTLSALHAAIERKQASETHLRNALTDAEHCLQSLLRAFRDANRRFRLTAPPAYFDAPQPLGKIDWPDFSVGADRAKYAEQAELLERFIERLEAIRGNIQSSFVRHHDGLTPLDQHFHAENPA